MGYVTEHLMPGERVVHQTRLHWIIFSWPILLLILAVAFFGLGSEGTGAGTFVLLVAGILAIVGAVRLQTSEFAVTDRRVLIKVGLFSRRSLELNLAKVESVNVEQEILGRILDYGTLIIIGTGGTKEAFKNIADPLPFRTNVQHQADLRTSAELHRPPDLAVSGTRAERECPYCAELILAKAKVCKHCGRDVQPVTT